MSSQLNRKLQTRKALLDATLALVEEGRHFSSISLREIAKKAGVAPNAFYRHFKDIDELGLALTDELSMMLRQLMRQARMQSLAADRMIYDSVDFYIAHVFTHPALFRFMAQIKTGGSPAMREAIRHELSYFSKELVSDLHRLRILPHLEPEDMEMLGHMVVNTVSSIGTELLDLPEDNDHLVAQVRARTVKQIRLAFIGAQSWKSKGELEKRKKRQK